MKTVARIALLLCATLFAAAPASGQGLVVEEFMVPGADPGVQLYVRNKRLPNVAGFSADNVVLFVHGATYPAETSFDLQLDGLSWMDYIASRGYDVYLVDVRGYGRSSRPAEMDQPAERNQPIVRTDVAARDYGAAADFIRKRRNIAKLTAMAWSWGTSIAATYTAQNNDKVTRLVLYAPQWLRETKSLADTGGALGAYRIVTLEAAMKRRGTGIPEGKKPMPDAWAEQWANATFASDPAGANANPRYVRAPNGVLLDGREYWSSGKPLYDPAAIRVPTLLVVAEWDADTPVYMAQALFPKLVNARPKRLVIIGEGTHSVLMETNRTQLFREVQMFLDERGGQH